MSYERDRVAKCVEKARRSVKKLVGSNNSQEQQDEWENFLEEWKKALERMRSYAAKRKLTDRYEAIHNERVADPMVNYAWEARNVEAHDIDGGSRQTEGALIVGPVTPGGGVGIRNLSFVGGVLRGTIENGRVTHIPAGIELQTLSLRGGKKLSPPEGKNARDVAQRAMTFVDRHFEAVFRSDGRAPGGPPSGLSDLRG